MHSRLLAFLCAFVFLLPTLSPACCALGRNGEPVVNADQTVLVVWDPETKTEHFIRKASFKEAGDDFGFLVPTPSRPQLSESGNAAFPALAQITRPLVQSSRGFSCGCSAATGAKSVTRSVRVIEQKEVAGFDASVLSASSASALNDWLKTNGYHYSPEVEAWAAPYIRDGWMLTALKVAKRKDAPEAKTVEASALRISFQTDRPIFPYREPDSRAAAKTLGDESRLLRLYFISTARFEGKIEGTSGWSGRPVWSNALAAPQKENLLGLLKLPTASGPANWWLTEFEDRWPYGIAAGDLYFSKSADQQPISRGGSSPQIPISDISILIGLVLAFGVILLRWLSSQKSAKPVLSAPAKA